MPEPVLILGARRFSREVADLLGDLPEFELKGFVENQDREGCGHTIDGLPVYWVDEIAAMAATHRGICALGSTQRSGFIGIAAAQGLDFITLVHPGARVSSRSTLGKGCVVCPGAQVASHTKIGAHVLVNRGALIGHDVEIGDYVTIGPGANIAGRCKIDSGVFVGIGAVVVEKLTIGGGSVIAAGAVVTRDVADHVMVAGMPAVVVKRGVDGL
jgi:sugar O-acyltransferase (sialic acid O-acetyltransferase NeuD family)